MRVEQRAVYPTAFNFSKIFYEKLQTVAPFSQQDGESVASDITDIGVTQVRRKAVAIVFTSQGPVNGFQYDIWIKDPQEITDTRFPHYKTTEDLMGFLSQNKASATSESPFSAYIYQDKKDDKVYLMLKTKTGEQVRDALETDDKSGKLFLDRWLDLIERYHLEKIIADFGFDMVGENGSTHYVQAESLVGRDVIGNIRENNHLLSFAEKYQLTNFQFMRFRLLVKDVHKAGVSVNYDEVIKAILVEDSQDL